MISSQTCQSDQDLSKSVQKPPEILFSWQDNPDIQNLLDIIVSILSEEYIQIAKKNPEIFTEKGASL